MGPLKSAGTQNTNAGGRNVLEASFNTTLDRYRQLLTEVDTGQLALPNDNFDTGEIPEPEKYRLNDVTHAKWSTR